jgi:HEAT repeat protein
MVESREARMTMVRLAMRKPRGAPTKLLQGLVGDSDENIARIAVRELIRRRLPECDNFLLQRMATVPDSVRRVIGRAIGQSGFEQYWERFDRLDKPTRRSAGRAIMKLFTDSANRLARRIAAGSVGDRVKAMQIAHELEMSEPLRAVLLQACADTSPKVRSKAVQVLGQLSQFPSDALMDRVLTDPDARVRANAIEVLENRQATQYIPILTDRARQASNRERANAIKALHRMRVGAAAPQLLAMLKDARAEHRISALWTLRQIGIWQMVNEVARLAREDDNVKVRRYAIGVLRAVASAVQQQKKKGSA